MKAIPDFVEEEIDQGEQYMRSWNVVVVSESNTQKKRSERAIKFAGLDVQTISRRRIKEPIAPDDIYIKALMSADHSLLDLPEESRVDLAKELKKHGWKEKRTRRTQALGANKCPLILIYILDKHSCGVKESSKNGTIRVPITDGLEGDVVDDHIIALGFVFPDENPSDARPKKYLRLRLPDLNPEEFGEEPDDQDLAEIEVDPEDRRPRKR